MSVEHVEVLVEEPSMEALLRLLLPRLLGEGVTFQVYASQCKQDLMAKLGSRLRGYANWLPHSWRIVVVVDRDSDDCHHLKGTLEGMARQAGLRTKTAAPGSDWQIVNRVAIEELEAWFFGDMDAVRTAYPRVPGTVEARKGYRDPDAIWGGTWECFERVLQHAGYFTGGLRKIEAARAIGPHMDPGRNRSRSFQVFRDTFLW